VGEIGGHRSRRGLNSASRAGGAPLDCTLGPGVESMPRTPITTDAAPAAIGPYSQAVRHGNTVYLSGQIPLDPATGQLVDGDIATQARRVFANLRAVCEAAGGSLDGIVRVGIYVMDLGDFATVNAVMAEHFNEPYPARSTIQVSGLPRGARVEVDAVLALD
jgi:reactive intermediate/imine deaminase